MRCYFLRHGIAVGPDSWSGSDFDRPLTREEILEWVWGYQSSNTRTVDVHVARLRGELEQNANAPRHILTIHGVGYRFVP